MPANATPSYNQTQIIYTFTFSVSAVGGLSFDNTGGVGLATMQAYASRVESQILADTTIQGLIGADWVPVWGPVVYSEDTSAPTIHADNTMGCYYSPSNNLFVIAIAGTNPNSPFDWLNEDFEVGTLVAWSSIGGTGSGNISTGAATGLNILLNMTSQSVTLLTALSNYVTANKITNAQVAVGGHSLAGALSPCFALYMYNNQSLWNPTGQLTLSAYPTAGPTPGDSDFATYYESVIAANGITYSSVYNTLDVIPLAWEPDELETIPTIYDASIVPPSGSNPPDDFMGIFTCGLQLNAAQASKDWLGIPVNPYTQISTGRSTVAGTFDLDVDAAVVKKLKYVSVVLPGSLKDFAPTLTNVARFAAQAAAQHTIAYPPLLSISAFNTEYLIILAANKPTSSVQVDAVQTAVKRVTGVDLGAIDGDVLAKAAR